MKAARFRPCRSQSILRPRVVQRRRKRQQVQLKLGQNLIEQRSFLAQSLWHFADGETPFHSKDFGTARLSRARGPRSDSLRKRRPARRVAAQLATVRAGGQA